jgi:hypothetical protein
VSIGTLPGPPSDLVGRRITVIEFNDLLFRTHGIRRNPLSPGRPGFNRFDSPDGSYTVLYLGCDAFCAFVETFTHAAGTRAVTTTALKNKALSQLKPTSPLRLIDLTGSGSLIRMGADARLYASGYEISQLWSKALHDHSVLAHGLLYPSRLDPDRRTVSLFLDRNPKLVELSRQNWYEPGKQRSLLAEIMEHYGVELIENRFVTRVSRKPIASARQEEFF